jgi:hypothetical protein
MTSGNTAQGILVLPNYKQTELKITANATLKFSKGSIFPSEK